MFSSLNQTLKTLTLAFTSTTGEPRSLLVSPIIESCSASEEESIIQLSNGRDHSWTGNVPPNERSSGWIGSTTEMFGVEGGGVVVVDNKEPPGVPPNYNPYAHKQREQEWGGHVATST
jgi:hypothetical protein